MFGVVMASAVDVSFSEHGDILDVVCAELDRSVKEAPTSLFGRKESPPEHALLKEKELSLRTFTHKGLIPGKTYRYRVKEERISIGTSSFSAYSPCEGGGGGGCSRRSDDDSNSRVA